MRCPYYKIPRRSLMADARIVIDRSPIALTAPTFDAVSQGNQYKISPGAANWRPCHGESDRSRYEAVSSKNLERQSTGDCFCQRYRVLGKEYEAFVWRR
jgi:hypothetical protein